MMGSGKKRKAMRSLPRVAAMFLLLAAPATAMFIDVQFIGGVDIAAYATWAWGQGEPLPNQEVERAARATVEELMAAKGYVKPDGKADCYLTFHAKADEWFDGGLFKIEAVDGRTGKVVWRGKAEGTVNVQSTAKRQKLAVRAVKKMFKKFPERRTD
jgi:hypothetical protein